MRVHDNPRRREHLGDATGAPPGAVAGARARWPASTGSDKAALHATFASNWLAPDGRRSGGGLYLVETTSYEPDEDMLSLRDENFQCVEATVILAAGTVKFDAKRIHRIIGDATARLDRARRLG